MDGVPALIPPSTLARLQDTLFIRPHPAIWRFVTGVGLFYAMFMTYLLFQVSGGTAGCQWPC